MKILLEALKWIAILGVAIFLYVFASQAREAAGDVKKAIQGTFDFFKANGTRIGVSFLAALAAIAAAPLVGVGALVAGLGALAAGGATFFLWPGQIRAIATINPNQ